MPYSGRDYSKARRYHPDSGRWRSRSHPGYTTLISYSGDILHESRQELMSSLESPKGQRNLLLLNPHFSEGNHDGHKNRCSPINGRASDGLRQYYYSWAFLSAPSRRTFSGSDPSGTWRGS